MKAIVVSGDRNALDDRWMPTMITALAMIAPEDGRLVVIHGAAKGIDSIADTACRYRTDCAAIPVPAQWSKIGRAAGPIRNGVMLDVLSTLHEHGYDVEVHCFHDALAKSKGTKDMHNRAFVSGIDVYVWTSDAEVRKSTEKLA